MPALFQRVLPQITWARYFLPPAFPPMALPADTVNWCGRQAQMSASQRQFGVRRLPLKKCLRRFSSVQKIKKTQPAGGCVRTGEL